MQTRFRIEDPAGAAARREAAVQRLRDETGIDEAMIDALVEDFYARVRDDALIGPIFADRITDWAPHLAQMKLFWSSVALSTGVYQGRPMPKHLPLPSMRGISIAGWSCSPKLRMPCARPSPPTTSLNAPAASPKALNWVSPTPVACFWPRASVSCGPRRRGCRNKI